MKVKEIIVRKGIGGYHATAVTDKHVTVNLPGDKESDGGMKQITAHSDDLKSALDNLKRRMAKARADFRRARVRSNLHGTDSAAIRTILGESDDDWKKRVAARDPDFAKRMNMTDPDTVTEGATFEDFMALFEKGPPNYSRHLQPSTMRAIRDFYHTMGPADSFRHSKALDRIMARGGSDREVEQYLAAQQDDSEDDSEDDFGEDDFTPQHAGGGS